MLHILIYPTDPHQKQYGGLAQETEQPRKRKPPTVLVTTNVIPRSKNGQYASTAGDATCSNLKSSQKSQQRQQRINTLWDENESRNMSASTFLNRCSDDAGNINNIKWLTAIVKSNEIKQKIFMSVLLHHFKRSWGNENIMSASYILKVGIRVPAHSSTDAVRRQKISQFS